MYSVNRVHFCFRFKAWASKLDVTPAGVLVFAETGKELLPTEDIEQVVMNIHCDGSEDNALPHRKLQTVIRKVLLLVLVCCEILFQEKSEIYVDISSDYAIDKRV